MSQNKKKPVIIFSGPTGVGKTSTSIKIALKLIEDNLPVSIVNFDSLYFYKELNIGTAKPTQKEMQGVPHFLIDIASIEDSFDAAKFFQMAKETIDELHKKNHIVFLVGGSAFYLRAIIKGMYQMEETPPELKKELDTLYKEEGIGPFLRMLEEKDPKSWQDLHKNDHYRIRRAVEFLSITGRPISEEKQKIEEISSPYDLSKPQNPNWKTLHFLLDLPKDEHQKLLKDRVKEMFNMGLLDEYDEIIKKGYSPELKAFQCIGYKEITQLKSGQISSLDECQQKIFIHTRQLAKAQRTFFKKFEDKILSSPHNPDKIYQQVKDFLSIPVA